MVEHSVKYPIGVQSFERLRNNHHAIFISRHYKRYQKLD